MTVFIIPIFDVFVWLSLRLTFVMTNFADQGALPGGDTELAFTMS
jgi:hypothetical protein